MATNPKDDDLLPYALAGLIQRRNEIIAKIDEIRAQIGGVGVAASSTNTQPAATKKRGRRKRVLSPEAREKIAEAQRARWAASRTGAKGATKKGATSKAASGARKKAGTKRTLSPEARARIAEAQRKRWADSRKSK